MKKINKDKLNTNISVIVKSTRIKSIKSAINVIETVEELKDLKESEINMLIKLKRKVNITTDSHKYSKLFAGIQICINDTKEKKRMYENYLNTL